TNHLAAAAALGPLRFWHDDLDAMDVIPLLTFAATHPSQQVRREAIIAASYIGTPAALEAVLPVLDQPAGLHLAYAISSSLHSQNLSRHWENSPRAKDIATRLTALSMPSRSHEPNTSASDAAFDQQKDLQVLELGCVPERLLFTKETLKVRAGKPVKLIFRNPDATQHNFALLQIGTPLEEIGLAANEMAKSPAGLKKHFLPDDKRILLATKLLDPEGIEVLRFTAPNKPGTYPYLCTFPGHWILMKGNLIVK
ncbi:MAG: plastocyanin/azurin family copper-binding protein, partial [Verrucomicrobia bacterium]|nr:plastocyanin/azurin family copper-binding protein [Verrucomicrobiota bacterium]